MAPPSDEPNVIPDGRTVTQPLGKEITMDRYARRQHFERLCGLRDQYARLGPDDTVWIITVDDVIEWASDLLSAESVPSSADETPRDA